MAPVEAKPPRRADMARRSVTRRKSRCNGRSVPAARHRVASSEVRRWCLRAAGGFGRPARVMRLQGFTGSRSSSTSQSQNRDRAPNRARAVAGLVACFANRWRIAGATSSVAGRSTASISAKAFRNALTSSPTCAGDAVPEPRNFARLGKNSTYSSASGPNVVVRRACSCAIPRRRSRPGSLPAATSPFRV